MKNKKQSLRDLFNAQSFYPQQLIDSLIETISLCNSLTHMVIRKKRMAQFNIIKPDGSVVAVNTMQEAVEQFTLNKLISWFIY